MKGLDWYFKTNLLIRILLGLIFGGDCRVYFDPCVW